MIPLSFRFSGCPRSGLFPFQGMIHLCATLMIVLVSCGRFGLDASSVDAGDIDIDDSDVGDPDADIDAETPPSELELIVEVSGDVAPRGFAVGSEGALYIAGEFSGELDFDDESMASNGDRDAFVARFSGSGDLEWSRGLGGVGSDIILDLVLTSTQVVVSGTFDEEVDFGERMLTSVGGGDAFVATFDHSGGHEWVWQLGVGDDGHESAADIALGIDVDDEGDLYATGLFYGAADFGGGLVEAAGTSPRCFAVSLAASGAFRWAEVFGEGSACMGTKIAVTGTDVVSTGLFAETMSFGEDEVTLASGQGGFLASSATTDGAPQWLATFGGAPLAWGLGLAASPGGGSCVVGFFRGSVEGADGRHESVGDEDVFVACYEASGRQRWLRTFGGQSIDSAWGIAVSQTGDVIVTGFFTERMDVGEETLESAGEQDAFVVGFDSDGGLLWARQFGRSHADSGLDVVVSGGGDVYVSGVLDGQTDESIPPLVITDSSLFIARIRL